MRLTGSRERLRTFARAARDRARELSPRSGSPKTIVIVSTPRSGTHLLAHELAASGRVGLAQEFFHDELMADFATTYETDPLPLPNYIGAWHQQTAADNGVAAVVIFPDHVEKLAAKGALRSGGTKGLQELVAMLPDPAVVMLERSSVVDQAISFLRATRSGSWTRQQGEKSPEHPDYEFEPLTAHLLRMVWLREWVLSSVGDLGDLAVEHVTYHQLVASGETVVRALCESFGLGAPPQLPKPGRSRASALRPVREANAQSSARSQRFRTEINELALGLRWDALGSDAEPSVQSRIREFDNDQLRTHSESIEAHRASAFRRRPIIDPQPFAGTAFETWNRVNASPTSRSLTVLTHGFASWYLDRFYRDAVAQDLTVEFVDQWNALTQCDILHINSLTYGWNQSSFEAKRRAIHTAMAVVESTADRNVPILWSINEPRTPGTSHVALEQSFTTLLASVATTIHASSKTIAHQIDARLENDPRVVVGRVSAAIDRQGHSATARYALCIGQLATYQRLDHLDALAAACSTADSPARLVVVGTCDGLPHTAARLDVLRQAGATVIERPVSVDDHYRLASGATALLAPCHPDTQVVPVQDLAAACGTRLIATAGSATRALHVDWRTDVKKIVDYLVHDDASPSPQHEPDRPSDVTIADLLRGLDK